MAPEPVPRSIIIGFKGAEGTDLSFKGTDLSDIFDTFYGGMYSGRGVDVKSELHVSLKQAYFGTDVRFEINGEIIQLNIPKGIKDGQTIMFEGLGKRGSLKNGNLKVKINILKDYSFTVKDYDLYTFVDIDLYTAIFGGVHFINFFD